MSLLYVAPEWLDRVHALEHHDRNRQGADEPYWDHVGAMTLQGYPTELMAGARKLDAGGRPNPVLVPTLARALDMVTARPKPQTENRKPLARLNAGVDESGRGWRGGCDCA